MLPKNQVANLNEKTPMLRPYRIENPIHH